MEQTLRGKLTYKVTLMVAATLCIVVCSMVFTLMFGLFDEKVEKLRREVERKNRDSPKEFTDNPIFDRRKKHE